MTARCERPGCGKPMPARRNDGTGMKRRFCCRQCGYHQGQRIVINGDKANAPKVESAGSWWLEPDFYAKARLRFPPDAGHKSSLPVQTYGERDVHGQGGYRTRPKGDDRG